MDGWPDDTSRALIDAIAIADSDDSLKVWGRPQMVSVISAGTRLP
jgi:hypothetical protein